MNQLKLIKNLEWLRSDIIGRNKMFKTPYGEKPLIYADYTASGRCLYSIENYLMHIMQYYANTHTEDDFTGKTMTTLLHDAEKIIKKMVNAGKTGKVIFTESGTTGGITRLQQILGVYWPPATKRRINEFLKSCTDRYPERTQCGRELQDYIHEKKPIVFLGPYEHHSNEIMWRQTLCDVIQIPLNNEGEIDLLELEKEVSNSKYESRPKIGSFSAASNVSGIKTPVYEVARILHKYNTLACFDFAACAPYVEINMNKDAESYFDAVFLSPHKYLGGPGTAGLLIINENIYPKELPPCIAAGGTVDYVSLHREKYIEDIETREKPGTPAILQAIKIALAFQIKEKAGIDNIETIERFWLEKFYSRFLNNKKIVFYGPTDIDKKVNIIPFNIKHKDRILHPKFVTKLMNDLFGIQTRAGCSCAGPYGHRLLDISDEISKYYQCLIGVDNYSGLKPGWVRFNLHYALSPEEYDYITEVLNFIIEKGCLFLPLYEFDFKTGDWYHIDEKVMEMPILLDVDEMLQKEQFKLNSSENIKEVFENNLREANNLVKNLKELDCFGKFEENLESLMFFYAINYKGKDTKITKTEDCKY
ncbi:MAG: aminotransferase class V-fold PLP-dependent enzyme [Candidatus Cloacimonetes bacterium]|nr:aminotransferase class V-fold PLP-dependent enzyme [Candidatus Cloacimonadota bacterium]